MPTSRTASAAHSPDNTAAIGKCPRSALRPRFGWHADAPGSRSNLADWKMETDDGPLFAYLYSHFAPNRHLEFGTWQGYGTCLCLENSAATVWTINLPDGETKADGTWAYGHRVTGQTDTPPGAVTANYGQDEQGPRIYHRTDAASYIGHFYREKNLGHRVCQIYCDTRMWDTSAYPPDFFDSVLVDGGHEPGVVVSDTRKALSVLRPGGMILWHDFCPLPEIREQFASVRGVTAGIETLLPELKAQLATLCWIDPSWILLGIKK
jgi:predicted O-methyltransferase YrrM